MYLGEHHAARQPREQRSCSAYITVLIQASRFTQSNPKQRLVCQLAYANGLYVTAKSLRPGLYEELYVSKATYLAYLYY